MSYIFLFDRSSTDSISYETVSNVFLPVTSETGSLADSLSKAFSEKTDAGEVTSNTYFSNLPTFLPFVFMRFMWKANEKVQAKILKVICTFESALYLIYVLSSFLILNPLIFILTLAIPLKKKFPLNVPPTPSSADTICTSL